MSFFAQPTPAPKPKTKHIRVLAVCLAAVFVLLAVAQLFTFEKFPEVIAQMWLPVGELAPAWAAGIVTLEVAAVPFLLGMRLSRAMRAVSMVAGWLAVAAWLAVSLWINTAGSIVANSGFLGATVALPVGWWNVLFSAALGVLVAWASWGAWPLPGGRKLRRQDS